MNSTRGLHRYTESGLPNVTLANVEIRTCDACGEREVVIPKMEELHRLIARAIAELPTQLTGEQVRFLRTWLGYSATDFAIVMGVRPETVSRWEHGTYQIPATAERLLRLMVANQEPVQKYPIDLFKAPPKTVTGKAEALKFTGPNWKRASGE
jgi:putative zinc finger/helix-turn-helix YgiT family protein